LNIPTVKETDEHVEVHYVVDKDPVVSLKENSGGDHRSAYDDDEEGGAEMGGQRVQCAQQ